MAGTAVLKVLITADSRQASSELGKTSSGLSKWGKVAGAAAVAGLAVAGAAVVKFGVDSVKAAQESIVAQKRLESVFRAMGDTTGWSAKQADKYASALSKQIGVDDEVIKAGQAKLATFSNVSSKTAIMAGVFDRATAAGADLAATGFGSIESNAVLLGKALQDPVKGMSALARVGVTLTKSQQEQAKAMAEAGNVMGAQKIILGAVETQVKGTAAATATGADKMKVAWGEVQESVGKALMPTLTALANVFLGTVLPAVQKVADQLGTALGPTIQKVAKWVESQLLPALLSAARIFMGTVVPAVVNLAKVLGPLLMPVMAAVANIIKSLIVPAFQIAAIVFRTAYSVVSALLAPVLKALAPLFIRLSALVNENRSTINLLVGVLRVAGTVLTFVAKVIGAVLGAAITVAVKLIIGIINVIQTLVTWASRLAGPFSAAGNAMSSAFAGIAGVIHAITSAVQGLIGAISRIKIPSIPHLPGLGKSAPAAAASATAMATRAGGLTAGTRAASTSSGGLTINVNGALDPEGVARQIRRILIGHQVRVGTSVGVL
jgi:phage-related protein